MEVTRRHIRGYMVRKREAHGVVTFRPEGAQGCHQISQAIEAKPKECPMKAYKNLTAAV